MLESYTLDLTVPVRADATPADIAHATAPLATALADLEAAPYERITDVADRPAIRLSLYVDAPDAGELCALHDGLAELAFRAGAEGMAVDFMVDLADEGNLPELITAPDRHHLSIHHDGDPTRITRDGQFFIGPDQTAIEAAFRIHRQNRIADFAQQVLGLDRQKALNWAAVGAAMAECPDRALMIAMHRDDRDSDGDCDEAMWVSAQATNHAEGKALLARNRQLAADPDYDDHREALMDSGEIAEDEIPLVEPNHETLVDVVTAADMVAEAANLYRASPRLTPDGLDRFERAVKERQQEGETAP